MRPAFGRRAHFGGHRRDHGDPREMFGGFGPPQAHPGEPPFPPGQPFGPWPGGGGPAMPPGWPPPGWGPGPRGHGRGRGPGRRHRGDVRAAILALLAERPMHGYEMIQEIGSRSGGFWRPSPGSVYPTLQLLTDEGLITSREGGGKRLFELSEEGRAEVDKREAAPPWEHLARDVDPNEVNLRGAMGQLMSAIYQVAQAGTSGQKARAVETLNQSRRELYAILGEVDEFIATPGDRPEATDKSDETDETDDE